MNPVTRFLRERATSLGDRPYLTPEEGESVSYGELWRGICHVAHELEALGLAEGDSFLLPMANRADCVVLFFGALAAGRVPIITSLRSPPIYLDEIGERAGAKMMVSPAALELRHLPTTLEVHRVESGARDDEPSWPERGEDETAYILFSSGSTGRPKGILTSYRALRSKQRAMTEGYGLGPDDRHMLLLPIHHVSGIYHHLLMAMELGADIFIPAHAEAHDVFALIARERIGFVQLVPTLIAALISGDEEPEAGVKEHLRFVGSGSAPLTVERLEAFEARFGIKIVQCYGMTEASCAMVVHNPPDGERRLASAGKPLPDNEMQVWDAAGKQLPPGEVGEIVVRGKNLLTGNVGDEPKLQLHDGFMRTGDSGYMDEGGFIFHMGRRDEMLKRGGHLIYPREVEDAVLASVPGAVEAAAFGVPHEQLGQDLVCYVAFGDAEPASLRKMIRALRERLPPERLPTHMIPIDALPRVKGVKVDKRTLMKRFQEIQERT
jgi:acyl-CoA synthetase (AMP-forming)/AMP-acid ligase II